MDTSSDKWFVEQFHLRSPVEEFQESSRLEMERLREADPKFEDSIHREAVELTLRKMRPGLLGARL
jgi:hypothetical protein